jgi:hypothetical protein
MPKFTTDDLVLYMHNEMSNAEKAALEQELQNNWALKEKLQVIKESLLRLQKIKLQSPRRQTIDAIMAYAAKPGDSHAVLPPQSEYFWVKGQQEL